MPSVRKIPVSSLRRCLLNSGTNTQPVRQRLGLNSYQRRWQSSSSSVPSPHAQFYRETLPAMIPVALLGSAVYFGLKLAQTKLAAEKRLDEANARISQLEAEVDTLLSKQDEGRRQNADVVASEKASSRWWWWSL